MTPPVWRVCAILPKAVGCNTSARLAKPFSAPLALLVLAVFAGSAGAQQPKRICINLDQPWTHTGVMLSQGQTFTVTASGDMNWYTPIPSRGWRGCLPTANCHTSPAGTACTVQGFLAQGLACWSLIERVGGGQMFQVGTSLRNYTATSSGELLLGVNDTPNDYFDNTGHWQAEIAIGGLLSGITTTVPCVPPAAHEIRCIKKYPQRQSLWCWAAVTEILMQNAGIGSEYHQQCEQAAALLQKPVATVCGKNGDEGFDESHSTPWDRGGYLPNSLMAFNFDFLQEGNPSSIAIVESLWGALNTNLIQQEIGCGERPIGFAWSQNLLTFDPAHEMAIIGYATNPADGSLELHIFNPGIQVPPGPGATPNQGAANAGQKAPAAPAIVCMVSAECNISFDDFVKPAPYRLSQVVYEVHKKQ